MSRAVLSMAGSGQLASAIAAISVLPVCPPSPFMSVPRSLCQYNYHC